MRTSWPKAEVVRALAKARRVPTVELLATLSRDELKAACRSLGLGDGGRAKQTIIDRLVNGSGNAQTTTTRPTARQDDAPRKARGMAKKRSGKKRPIEQYDHSNERRANNPPVGLVTPQTDPDTPAKKQYQYDPHLEPQLVWAGKAERTSFEVPTVSLHVHERIDPRTIIEAVRAKNGNGSASDGQMPLFEAPDENPPLRDALDFYKHPHNWTNRLVAGDSMLVMNSLLEKEGMAGKVQMVFLDPPYGIRYGSNFQPFVNNRDVRDRRDDDLTQEPEMLKAFRDTWELGIHSYLTYLRDRLLLARELLTTSGSCFIQIGDENLHHARELMDEIFGVSNLVATIPFKKTTGAGSPSEGTSVISGVCDYLLWYAKDRRETTYNQLYFKRSLGEAGSSGYTWVEEPTGERRRMTADERADPSKIPTAAKVFTADNLTSQSGVEKTRYPIHIDGREYRPGAGVWKTSEAGMQRLLSQGRILVVGNTPRYVRYFDDFPVVPLNNFWDDTTLAGYASRKKYVVETNPKVMMRAILMATDPGDVVLDITCGSGTTAYVAEQWGRRWITCDTSRVAITLAKQRLMAGVYPYYQLAHPEEGVRSGFKYETVPHVTLKSLANDESPRPAHLYDQPRSDPSKTRVTGPFTVEAVPSPSVRPLDDVEDSPADDLSVARTGATVKQDEWRAELQQAGVRGRGGQRIEFTRIEPLGGTRYLHAVGETKEAAPKRVVVSFGPEHAPLEQRQVEHAWEEARTLVPKPEMIVFTSFQFDPEAAKDIDELTPEKTGMTFLKVQMNADMLTEDLKKKRSSNESFWLIGQPDVEVRKIAKGDDKGKWQVEVHGFDYYNPKKGTIESGDTSKIAMWMLDTDYDGRSLYPRQVFFPMAGKKDGWARLAKSLKAEIDEEKIEAYRATTSLPFDAGGNRRVAVKIVDDRGIESLKVITLQR